MRLISSGSGSGSLATYQTIATLTAPTLGAMRYRLEITLTGLNASHALKVKETQGATAFINPQLANNSDTVYIIEVGRSMNLAETSVVVAVIDTSGLSTGASWAYRIFEEDAALNIDGLTFEAAMTRVLAFCAGDASVTNLGSNVYRISFKKQDGSTESHTIDFNPTTGARP